MDYNITIPEYSRDLSKHMYQLQQAGLFCDAWLVCKDGVVFVHKLVLMACGSAYLLQQLSTDTSTSTQCQVFLKGYSLKTVYDFVQALYTGSFTLNHDRAFEMLNLCTFLDVSIFTSSVQGVVNNDSNLKQEVEKRQKRDDKNCVFYEVEIAQDSFSAPLKIPIKLLEDNVIMERIGDSTFNTKHAKGRNSQSSETISKRNWTSILNSDCVDNNKRKNNVDSSNTDSGIPQKQARVSKQSKNDVQTRPDIFSQQIKQEKEKLKIVKHVQDSQCSTIQSDHPFEVHDKEGVSKRTERLSAISGLIYEVDENSTDGTITDIDENSSEATITDIDENSSNGNITELQVDKSTTLSTSRGSSEKSKTLSTSRGKSEKSKTLSTSRGSSEKTKPLLTSKGSSEKTKPLLTSKGSSEKSITLSTSKGSSEKMKKLYQQAWVVQKIKNFINKHG
ncbi:unnamed protein product [Mytilus coruscus]|uniref:BTB domain-containing protein n=1 Tax=Mytilus coruscus TaxID=42192 RepID=A0A6J8DD06_MYTCO|nr:unnamed protein product [Mytilus coruscus]